jgi:hypothetical protein
VILEGIVTTCDAAGGMHLAAMGPEIAEEECASGRIGRLLLRPFPTSQTAANLARVPEGVFHCTDDVLLLARIVTGAPGSPPLHRPAREVCGWVLDNACQAYEFRVESADASQERMRLEARVVAVHEGRPFIGFNRARHAVVEGAILVTRLHLLGADEVARRLHELAVLVEKTGGAREREAFALLDARVADAAAGATAGGVTAVGHDRRA